MINYQHPIVQEDLHALHQSSVNWEHLQNKTVLVTGATGMLASYFSFMLLFLNEQYQYNIDLILLARNRQKLNYVYGREKEHIQFLVQDICKPISLNAKIDYIFHAAGAASPYYINHDPVGIIQANTLGTINVLELAKITQTRKVVFASTREVYGKVEHLEKISEDDMGTIDPLDERSCYPESKRMAESLLKSYTQQYDIKFNSLRIAHSYGPGMKIDNDGRVMADFINSIMLSKDIHLHSLGEAVRAFCYITDTINAIFKVMIDGKDNQAYNIANETEPISVFELAQMVQKLSGNNKQVCIPEQTIQPKGYSNYKRVMLDTNKIEALGWAPQIKLEDGILKTLKSLGK